jgi:nitrite reductase/ring-hydroxylating ferredoxin subunit/uncharacterized membrane protein
VAVETGGATGTETGVQPVLRETLAARIEGLAALDGAGELLQKTVARLVPAGSAAKDVLSGTWLGHPVHPPLTDLVVGSWTSAWLLDLLGGEDAEPAADALVGIGILAAVPTAAAGLSDWAELRGGRRRVGTVHALGNATALLLHALSLVARRRGRRAPARSLSTLGMGAATFSAWLGGHLTFGRGVGVDQTAFESFPDEWTAIALEEEVEDRVPIRRAANGSAVMLVRDGGRIFGLADRCSHRGCSLSEGSVADGAVTCRCHGSRFELASGRVLRGPAAAPQPPLAVRVEHGKVEVRRPSE